MLASRPRSPPRVAKHIDAPQVRPGAAWQAISRQKPSSLAPFLAALIASTYRSVCPHRAPSSQNGSCCDEVMRLGRSKASTRLVSSCMPGWRCRLQKASKLRSPSLPQSTPLPNTTTPTPPQPPSYPTMRATKLITTFALAAIAGLAATIAFAPAPAGAVPAIVSRLASLRSS